ncbi:MULTISPECIES: hypothetical protein [Pseudomonas]|uniref:Uncharacterized protein n=1 Tax=Pseudomonas putida NBRC 14164 TaxID=1211579 RepID=A0ABN5UIZ2_PSEPU|nr:MULTISPECIES: hypothetical protein [Pseudomonas]MCX9135184.1 hypothetical protein [Pseudomonas sp. DCB_PUT]MDD1970617.1 hypothetical protein [Pseudomonas putida]MDO1462929.1 hypothetical protein [Pseudomonas putida]MDO1468306.1 hypothetical protein [Pseudomonas putida]MDZ7328644.1 hypothetical protein [Pseudomonas sp. SDS3-8]
MTISNITSQPPVWTSTNHSSPTPSSNEAEPKALHNERIYQNTFTMISERYQDFRPDTEVGFQQRPGVTADIEPISKKDLISILEHIKADDKLLNSCKNKSAKAAFFNKFYLMSNADQGWNLRLHSFNVRGSGLGEEDSPHYHRWTLASKILSGGYLNVNYQEGPKTDSTSQKDSFSKYELSSSKAQTSAGARESRYISEAEMKVTNKTLYAQGGLNHFPIAQPHSVEAHAAVMGTTLTLAHTSKPAHDTSVSFKKSNNIETIPEIKIESNEAFKTMLQDQITHLQVLVLSDSLNTSLSAKFEQGSQLTTGEEKHLADYKEPNYVETSLLPALAIYQMETLNNIEHSEFSDDTVALIDATLTEIDPESLDTLIANNQHDLYDKQLTIEIDDPELARQLSKRANQAIALH